MNIELGGTIVKKVFDAEFKEVSYYIFFNTGEMSKPIMILDDYSMKKLIKELED